MKRCVINKMVEYPIILSNSECSHLLLILNDCRESIEFKKWFVQSFMDVYLVNRDKSEFKNVLCFLPDINEKILDKCPLINVDTVSRNKEDDILKKIRHWIDNGKFVIIQLNKFYLPCASEYHKYNIIHRVLIYGYNEEDKILEAADMFKLTGYTLEKIKYEDFIQACSTEEVENKAIEIITYSRAKCILDMQSLKEKIWKYIEENEEFKKCASYQALANSLQQDNFLDEISCNVLYEHQRIITKKVEFLQEMKLINFEPLQLSEFYDFENEMMQFRNSYIKYRIKSKFKEQLVEKSMIQNRLRELHRKHISYCKLLLGKLEEKGEVTK